MKNKIQLLLTATLLCAVLPGCSSDHTDPVQIAAAGEEDSLDNSTSKESGEDLKVLIDYFDRVTGTPMELPYDRIILYESEEEEDILCVYKDITTESETVSRYSVSKDGYSQVLKVIYDNEMDRWNLRDDTYPIDGGYYYLNYWNGEKYVQVTSDAMPDSGFGDFAAVEKSMYGLLEGK